MRNLVIILGDQLDASASALVDFGHDLRAVGAPPDRPAWHIGLEDPRRPGATGCIMWQQRAKQVRC